MPTTLTLAPATQTSLVLRPGGAAFSTYPSVSTYPGAETFPGSLADLLLVPSDEQLLVVTPA